MGKLKVGIDINEVLRARWQQFDRFFVEEFHLDGSEEQVYVYDFFKDYPWKDVIEEVKEMREPEDTPDTINPIDYQVDEKGNAPADFMLFKKAEKVKLTARQVYNRFMYEDYLFEIHGAAPKMYTQVDLDTNNFLQKYYNNVEFIVMSVENRFSIPPTLFFLSKISSRFKNYKFVDNAVDMWKHVDILITTDPELLNIGAPWFKKIVKVKRPYNENIKAGSLEILKISELIGNKVFEKIIKYKSK